MNRKAILGGVLFAGAYCLLGVVSGISKYLQSKWGFPPAELTFFNYGILTMCVLPWVIKQGGLKALKTSNYPLILIRSVLGFSAFLLFFTASHILPLVDAVTLLNTAPLWVPLFAMFVLGDRLSRKPALCILGGFIGMLLIMRPRIQGMNFTGDAVGLASGIMMATAIVIMSKLKHESWQRVSFHYGIVGVLLSSVFMIHSFKMPQGIQWLFFLAMGGITYLIQWFATVALHHAKAITVGPLSYSSIIVSGIIGWLVWGQIPTFLTIIGMFVVVISGILIVMFEARGQMGVDEPLS